MKRLKSNVKGRKKKQGYINNGPLREADWEFEFKGSEALGWQNGAWSCGYICLFALIKAKTLNEEAKMAFLSDEGKFHLKKCQMVGEK